MRWLPTCTATLLQRCGGERLKCHNVQTYRATRRRTSGGNDKGGPTAQAISLIQLSVAAGEVSNVVPKFIGSHPIVPRVIGIKRPPKAVIDG